MLTAREFDKKLDVAMEALSRKGVYLAFSMPEWMQRSSAEACGALDEYLEYRHVLEELGKAIDRERQQELWENGATPVQMVLPI